MRVFSGLLLCLLTNEYLSGAIGFWAPFKHKKTPVKKNLKIKETKEILYEEGNWDDGEVVWENMQDYNNTNETYTFIKKRSLENTTPLYKSTPLYNAIEMDQTKIASISALVRTTYRETFNMDTIISEFHNKFTNHYTIIPSELVVISMLTGLAIVYKKTNEAEKTRLEKLYKLSNESEAEYYEKYKRMKRVSIITIIVLSYLTTKNVQPVE